MVLDGKISGQPPRCKLSNTVKCGQCCKLIPAPLRNYVKFSEVSGKFAGFNTYNYLHTSHFIYETKSGYSICYCSDKCRRKHNHRFTNKIIDNIDKIAMVLTRFWADLKIGDRVLDTIYNQDATVLSISENGNLKISTPEHVTDTDNGFRYFWEIDFPKDRRIR